MPLSTSPTTTTTGPRRPRRTGSTTYVIGGRSNGGITFAAPINVTDVVSLSDFEYVGDYFDTTTTMRRFHTAWTDRGDQTSVMEPEDDMFADRF